MLKTFNLWHMSNALIFFVIYTQSCSVYQNHTKPLYCLWLRQQHLASRWTSQQLLSYPVQVCSDWKHYEDLKVNNSNQNNKFKKRKHCLCRDYCTCIFNNSWDNKIASKGGNYAWFTLWRFKGNYLRLFLKREDYLRGRRVIIWWTAVIRGNKVHHSGACVRFLLTTE